MSDKKNIEEFFKEKFQNFEATPLPETWDNINSKLKKKELAKPMFPFWLKSAGVAAIFLVGFFLGDNFNSTKIKTTILEKPTAISKSKNTINKEITETENQISETNNSDVINPNQKNNSEKISNKNSFSFVKKTPKQFQKATISVLEKPENDQKINSVFENKISNNLNSENSFNNEKNIIFIQNKISNNSENSILNSEEKFSKNSILKPLSESEIVKKDSINKTIITENPLTKIENKKEELPLPKVKILRWKIRPNAAPIYTNSSQGSPISTSFADNTKEFENTTSVGIGLDYAINNRFSIRSGVNKYDMQYNTNDIVYYADLNPTKANSNLKTIDKDPKAASMVVEDKNTTSVSTTQSSAEALQTKNDGLLNQKLGYIEVPVELSYKLLDKKFGIELITGISTMFLNANQVSVVSQGKSTILGVANNLNTIHFSTNIGFGISYNFMKSFQINIEPTLKYQLNTFSDNSGGFKPYIIGIYSGLSYRF